MQRIKICFRIAANRILSPFGLEVSRLGMSTDNQEYVSLVKLYSGLVSEIEGYFKEFIDKEYMIEKKRTSLLCKLLGTEISEALFIIKSLKNTQELEGDICEFGVAQGATSALMANEIFHTNKRLWLFDSFEGLSRPTKEDILIDDVSGLGSMERYEGLMSVGVHSVKNKLKEVNFPDDRIKIVPGFISDTLKRDELPNKVSFAYVDFDFYEPIKLALEFLDTTLEKNGEIIVDDYGYFSAGAKTAVDEFVANHTGRYEILKSYPFAGHFIVLKKNN
jgi:O-methyltransferase